jgi:macrolide-specific efflux system membrane fusion protein
LLKKSSTTQNGKMNRKNLINLILLTFLLLSACSTAATNEESTPTPLPTPIIPTKPTYTVQLGEIVNQLDFTGRIVPVVQEELSFTSGGHVDKVFVKKGDQVTKGQILAQLDTGNRDFDLKRAQIHLDMANINLELTKLNTPSYAKTYDLQVQIQEKNVELAQLALDELEALVAASQIVSPMDGQVMALYVAEDDMAEAYKPLIIVADTNQLEVSAEPSSSTLSELAEGMEVEIQSQVVNKDSIQGVIRSLPYPYGKSSTNSGSDTSVRIQLFTDPIKAGYGLGDLVKVLVTLEKKEAVLWLPPQAIRTFEGRKFVVIKDGEGRRRVDVKIGIANLDRVEIIEGVSEGQTIEAP